MEFSTQYLLTHISIGVLFWSFLTLLIRMIVNIPSKIDEDENPRNQKKMFAEYVTNYISVAHALFLITICNIYN